MTALQDYLDRANRMNRLFKKPEFDLSVARDRHEIAAHISGDLSPENLHCDGEISPAQARLKYKHLMAVAKELAQIDPTVRIIA